APPREAPGSPTGLPPPTAHDQTSPAMDACRVQRPHHHSVTMNYFAAHMQRTWPGTSKWNKIEHRLFSHITMNWRGRPLTSHEVVVQTIAATRTSSGLRVEATLDPGDYPTGVAISKERSADLPQERHAARGAWNYTLQPAAGAPPAGEGTADHQSSPARRRQDMLGKLSDERLTGMTSAELACLCAALAPRQAA